VDAASFAVVPESRGYFAKDKDHVWLIDSCAFNATLAAAAHLTWYEQTFGNRG
jgi:hypothetical protein